MKILLADPAKNITALVFAPPESAEERAALARAILAESRLKAEQVGFVTSPAPGGLWRLEMAGGEFCGNAARSLGLYAARAEGRKGKAAFPVSVSGAAFPLAVEVDTGTNRASAEMPLPLAVETLQYKGRVLPVIVFEGITHVIAPGIEASVRAFHALKAAAERKLPAPPAFGVMFHDNASGFTRPAVYVRATDTLFFESSCGSGSAALGIWKNLDARDGAERCVIAQPGGVIETEVVKKEGKTCRVSIGGEVTLGVPLEFPWPPSSARQSRT